MSHPAFFNFSLNIFKLDVILCNFKSVGSLKKSCFWFSVQAWNLKCSVILKEKKNILFFLLDFEVFQEKGDEMSENSTSASSSPKRAWQCPVAPLLSCNEPVKASPTRCAPVKRVWSAVVKTESSLVLTNVVLGNVKSWKVARVLYKLFPRKAFSFRPKKR